MLRDFFARGVLYWLRAPGDYKELRDREWLLAIVRLLLSICCVSAVLRADLSERLYFFAAVSISYAVFSLGLILALHFRSNAGGLLNIGIHLADILWAVNLLVVIHWPQLEFAIVLFLLISAAIRWGFWETALTGAGLSCLQALSCPVYHLSISWLWHYASPRHAIAGAVLYFAGIIGIGILAEMKSLRSERYAIANALEHLPLESGLEQALRKVCITGLRFYGATQVVVALHQKQTGRAQLFRTTRSQPDFHSSAISISDRPLYFFPASAETLRLANTSRRRDAFLCHTLKEGKIRKEKSRGGVPDAFLSMYPFHLLLSVSMSIDRSWDFRIYLIDPLLLFGGRAGLRFLDRAVRQITPAIYDLFLVDRTKRKVEADVSRRMAHELHDGVIQSLCCINMQLDDLRNHPGGSFAPGEDPLSKIQESVRKEIAELRELTDQLRSLEIDSSRLLGYLAGLTVKFQCQHGILTKFVSDVDDVQLQPHVCVELARIAQEALVNIRKHSNASEVLVRFGARNGDWVLSIIDNGRGFGFSGRLSHEELQSSGRGPIVIMERARKINGRISIESIEDGGSSIEVVLPREADL